MADTEVADGPWTKYQQSEAAPAESDGPWTKYQASTQEEPKRGFFDELGRQVGLTARAGINGLAALPAMASDALISGPLNAGLDMYDNARSPTMSELVTGKQKGFRFKRASDALNDTMTAAGVAAPENASERVVQDIASGMAGTGGTIAAGKALASGGGALAKGVGDLLSAGPGLQVASAAAGSGASGLTREGGGGQTAQLVAGLAGGMAPSVLPMAGKAAVRGMLRGGEEGRLKAAENLAAFEAAGTTPTLGQATGGRMAQATESLLAKTPGGAGVIAKKAQDQADEMAKSVQNLSDELAPGANATNAGEAIDKGVQKFKEMGKLIQQQLYAKLDKHIPPETRIASERTQAALADLNTDIAGAPELSKWFKNARIQGIEGALSSDTGGAGAVLSRPGMAERASALRASLTEEAQNAAAANERHFGSLLKQVDDAKEANRIWRIQQAEEAEAARQANLQWRARLQAEAEKAAARNEERRALGMRNFEPVQPAKEIQSLPDKFPVKSAREIAALPAPNLVMSAQDLKSIKPPNFARSAAEIEKEVEGFLQNQIDKKLPYESIKKLRTLVGKELENNSLVADVPRSKWTALYSALSDDLGVAAKNAGPEAETAWTRANAYTRKLMDRLENVKGVVNKDTPERVFAAATNGTAEGATNITRVINLLPLSERREVAAAVLQRMGRATPGQQNGLGEAFSSETFLTNLSKFSPEAKRAIFGRTGLDGIEDKIQTFAKVAAIRREGGKVFANPSGTASATAGHALGGGALYGVGSALLGNPLPLVGVAAAPVGANIVARGVTRPGLPQWAATKTPVTPGMQGAMVGATSRAVDPRLIPVSQRQPEEAQRIEPSGMAQPDPEPDHIAAIGAATNIDEAIQAAGAAVQQQKPQAESKPIVIQAPAPPPPPEPMPVPEKVSMTIPGGTSDEPASVWFGRRGDGYQSPNDAFLAMRARQKLNPGLKWEVEEMPSGRYRIAGYEQAGQMQPEGGAMGGNQGMAFQAIPRGDGTLAIRGNPAAIQQALAQQGIRSIPMQGGVMVGVSQAQAALGMLQQLEQVSV